MYERPARKKLIVAEEGVLCRGGYLPLNCIYCPLPPPRDSALPPRVSASALPAAQNRPKTA